MRNVATTLPPREEMVRAFLQSDGAYEGVFFTGVKTTGIFCRPVCPARKPKPENVEFFASSDEAMASGFRPCKRCRPLQAAEEAPDWLKPLLAKAEAEPARRWTNEELEAEGLEPVRVRRWFQKHFGMTFHAYIRSRRLGAALGRLNDGDSIDGVAYDHGYESVSGFREAFQKDFGVTPGRAQQVRALYYTRLTTPLGPMLAAAEDRGLVLAEFLDRPALVDELETLQGRFGYAAAPGSNAHLDHFAREIAEYFDGRRQRFEVPLSLPGTDFERRVWTLLQQIPYGSTWSYGQMAQHLGQPGASRAVGLANGRNRAAIIVPCHRVIGADGSLVGYGGGQWRKAWLLKLERGARTLEGMGKLSPL